MRNLAAAGCRVLALVHKPRPVEIPLVDYRQWDLATPMTSAWFDGADGAFLMAPIRPDMVDIGKRLNQIARISGSITVPDVLRDRFQSPAFGLLAVSLNFEESTERASQQRR